MEVDEDNPNGALGLGFKLFILLLVIFLNLKKKRNEKAIMN